MHNLCPTINYLCDKLSLKMSFCWTMAKSKFEQKHLTSKDGLFNLSFFSKTKWLPSAVIYKLFCSPLEFFVPFGDALSETGTQGLQPPREGGWRIDTVHSPQSSISILTLPGTIQAECCLTSVFKRELAFPTWHSRELNNKKSYFFKIKAS